MDMNRIGRQFVGTTVKVFTVVPSTEKSARRALRMLSRTGVCLLAALVLLGCVPAMAKSKESKLPERYRKWLERDAAYIITRHEKDTFLQLTSDQARDEFIKRFWAIRNPTPGAPDNPFEEEHYRRLAYADAHFGSGKRVPGWTTDRGLIYITLGPPQQRANYMSYERVRPMEIWFYSSAHPALPPFFYIVFYQPDNGDDFKLYSPYFDGPTKLATERGLTPSQAIQQIERDAGREVARISLSLLPDEPVDLQAGSTSLASDLIVAKIRDLANNPFSLDQLARRRLQEDVTARLILSGQTLSVLTVPLRDRHGVTNLHYLLRLRRPQDFALGRLSDGRYYYSIEARVQVYGPDNKLIFTQQRTVKRNLAKNEVEQIKDQAFGYEGILPLPPGKYHLQFLLTNWITQTAFKSEKEVVVRDVPTQGVSVTELVPFSDVAAVAPVHGDDSPFTVAGVKFTPMVPQELALADWQDLKFFYQIWSPPADPHAQEGKKLEATIAYGRLGASGDAQQLKEEIQQEQFDPHGSMVSGKKIPLRGLDPGNYLLTLSLKGTGIQQETFSRLNFQLLPGVNPVADWDVVDPEAEKDLADGVFDFQRGLCFRAQQNKKLAAELFQKALQRNPTLESARSALVELYFGQQAFTEIAALTRKLPLTAQTDESTILQMAESLDHTGETKGAIGLLESALIYRPTSGPLYLTLAGYYQRIGDTQKAQELQRKGKSLMSSNSPSS